MDKMKNCKTCGAEMAASAKVCPACGAKNRKPFYKKVWFWLLILFVVVPTVSVISGSDGNYTSNGNNTPATSHSNGTVSSNTSVFDGDCGISASAEMGSSIIGYPELTISITNTSEKEISAIQFYVVPCDVYGDELTSWKNQNKLYTDTAIASGKSNTISFQFIEDRVKTVKLHVYSVYFADGTEWGDKTATTSAILNNGAIIEVSGQS